VLNWFRHRPRRWSWIAALAIFGLVFAPTIARAMAGLQGAPAWQEICSAGGAKASARADAEPAKEAAQRHLDHCPMCGLSADIAPPIAARVGFGPVPAAPSIPARLVQAPSRQHPWAAPKSRAPPPPKA
jgi:Protein of unknown function (DUF2946)